MADKYIPENIGLFSAYIPNYQAIATPNLPEGALVYANQPNKVFYDPRYLNVPNMFQHEFEHQLNRTAGKRYKEDFEDVSTRPEYKYWIENLNNFKVNPIWAADELKKRVEYHSEDIAKAFKEKTGKDLAKGSRIWNAKNESLSELLAELSSIESVLKTDFATDPKFKTKIFGTLKTDEIANTYRSVTGGRQDRLDAKDLAPYTAQPVTSSYSPWDNIVNILKDTVR